MTTYDDRYLAEEREFADSIGMRDSLENCITRVLNFIESARKAHNEVYATIRKDFTKHSFYFCIEYEENFERKHYLNGGIIYHGCPEEGYRENCSVMVSPSYGWSIHT